MPRTHTEGRRTAQGGEVVYLFVPLPPAALRVVECNICITNGVNAGAVNLSPTDRAFVTSSVTSRRRSATGRPSTRVLKRSSTSGANAALRYPLLATSALSVRRRRYVMDFAIARVARCSISRTRQEYVRTACAGLSTTCGQGVRGYIAAIAGSDKRMELTSLSTELSGKRIMALCRKGADGTSTTRIMTGSITGSKIWS